MYEIDSEEIIKAQNNDEEAMTKIIKTNSGLIWSIVKRFLGRGYDKEELEQIAKKEGRTFNFVSKSLHN